VNDVIHGSGRMAYKNGDTYEGSWEKGLKHGSGMMTFECGDVYRGEFVADEFSGNGKYNYAPPKLNPNSHSKVSIRSDPEVYVGQWLHNMKHGIGTYHYSDGDVYSGDWVCNKKDGKGVMNYANGDKYEGEFTSNVFQGHGVYSFECGDRYEVFDVLCIRVYIYAFMRCINIQYTSLFGLHESLTSYIYIYMLV
jgi:hypothetical protein